VGACSEQNFDGGALVRSSLTLSLGIGFKEVSKRSRLGSCLSRVGLMSRQIAHDHLDGRWGWGLRGAGARASVLIYYLEVVARKTAEALIRVLAQTLEADGVAVLIMLRQLLPVHWFWVAGS